MKSLMVLSEVLVVAVVLSLLCGCVLGKECTNIPTELSSKTVRAELLSSKNKNASWKTELLSRYHSLATTTDASALSTSFLTRRVLNEESWAILSKKVKNSTAFKLPNILKEVSLHDVRIDPSSIFWVAQQTNLEYMLMLDVDNLVWSFRKMAGLPTPGNPYGGWEAPDTELRGHFVGHYLSATALMWASTHNNTLKEKMTAVVSALAACQDKIGTGYLSAFPTEFFDRYEAIKLVWAPYYTIHKILAGLLDQYTFAGNDQALKMVTRMVEYFYNRVQNVLSKYSVERHYLSLNEEVGGMNDVLYRLYTITQDQKHLLLAHLFDKPCFLGVLAVQADDIAGFHANTHIPLVIGAQMRYEVTGDPLYKDIATFFMDIVNSTHAYATGGTSSGEFWTDPKRLATTLRTENEESCTTYNMLKVSRHLFRWTKEITYADYYERALTNGVLGIQRGRDPGVMIYMLPLGRGVSKAKSYHGWGTKFDSFWCCYGTGIESFSKLGDSIYFEEEGNPGLYIIRYISSSLDWKSGQILINQKVEPVVSWDSRLQVTLTIEKGAGSESTLNLRIPFWTHTQGAKATVNGEDLPQPIPGQFLPVSKKWNSGDKITLELPISLRTEAIKDDRPEYATVQAILYGPYLLAGLTTGDWDIKTGNAKSLSDWITPIPESYHSNLISLSQGSGNSAFALANVNQTIAMQAFPLPGTNLSVPATFRLVLKDSAASSKISAPKDAIGKLVMLEPFDFPGMVVVPHGTNGHLIVAAPGDNAVFHLVAGLNGKPGTVSLESNSQKGCFVYGGVAGANSTAGQTIKLHCQSGETPEAGFKEAASFVLNNGINSYHPMSFVAKGAKRNFLLTPLYNFMDESYTPYFNITA